MQWGYAHKTVCHGVGEYARDDDGEGFCEVHVNTMEAFGRSCVPDCVPIAGSLKKSYRCIWASLSSCTTPKSEAKLYSLLCWRTYLLNSLEFLLSLAS